MSGLASSGDLQKSITTCVSGVQIYSDRSVLTSHKLRQYIWHIRLWQTYFGIISCIRDFTFIRRILATGTYSSKSFTGIKLFKAVFSNALAIHHASYGPEASFHCAGIVSRWTHNEFPVTVVIGQSLWSLAEWILNVSTVTVFVWIKFSL